MMFSSEAGIFGRTVALRLACLGGLRSPAGRFADNVALDFAPPATREALLLSQDRPLLFRDPSDALCGGGLGWLC